MKMYKQPSWQYETTGVEGNATLFGVNIFDYEWVRTGRRAKIKHPTFDEEDVFEIYKVTVDGVEYEFACGELSNCVYGFYVMKY